MGKGSIPSRARRSRSRIKSMQKMYHRSMHGGMIVREARLRAGLTQRALARAVSLSQPTLARIESGAVRPTLDQVDRCVTACGLELRVALVPADDSDWSVASANLRLDPDARVRQHQAASRFIRAGRAALLGRGA
jgi:transcriptional regulator with XRE-family HTH domain